MRHITRPYTKEKTSSPSKKTCIHYTISLQCREIISWKIISNNIVMDYFIYRFLIKTPKAGAQYNNSKALTLKNGTVTSILTKRQTLRQGDIFTFKKPEIFLGSKPERSSTNKK